MSSRPPVLLLEGRIEPDEVGVLRRKVERLERELENTQDALLRARGKLASASEGLKAVRRQLEPLYDALRMVFGELEVSGIQGASTETNPRVAQVWESWKSKLPGKRADFIQALCEHRELTTAQLRVATHTAAGSVAGVICELKKLGLINKNGGKYSLKEL